MLVSCGSVIAILSVFVTLTLWTWGGGGYNTYKLVRIITVITDWTVHLGKARFLASGRWKFTRYHPI